MARRIDLNCDMGESWGVYDMGDDDAMLEVVTSANIACGFHAGDPLIMHRTLERAKANGVHPGAHPSFLDPWGFGRRPIQGERPADITKHLIYQIGAIRAMADSLDWPLRHVKIHGALYNMAAVDADLARACVDAVVAIDRTLVFVAPPYSEVMVAAEKAGLTVAQEIFADRAYDDNGQLVSRKLPGAVIHDPDQAAERALAMITDRRITSLNGKTLAIEPETICVHGDTPGAVDLARRLRGDLEREGITIAPIDP